MAAKTADSLTEYRRKRDFARTAEPPGKVAKRKGNSFLVQKHDATRLHYDFRLELDCVLKSWAVTRGPSLDPAEKRLAVHVEDHPLGYGGFEGTIPKGEYGGGTVMLWDRGTWEPLDDPHEGLRKGHLHFHLDGERLKGGWALIRMPPRGKEKRENWLLIKERDEFAEDSDTLLESATTSVASGRTMEEIARGDSIWHSNKPDGRSKPASRAKRKRADEEELDKPEPLEKAMAEDAKEIVKAGIRVTHPGRVVFPDQGLTKNDLVEYYEVVADLMLPHVGKRPLSLVRCPAGANRHCFFQKHDTGGFPDAMQHVDIEESSGTKDQYFYVTDLSGIVAGVQMSVLEFHIWGSRVDQVEKPDRIVFDLDPDVGLGFEDVRRAAFDLRDRLEKLGLTTFPMLSGGKGFHIVAPLTRRADWIEVKAFCKGFADMLGNDAPDRYVSNMAKAKRKGRIFIDYLRNERGSTAISPYSTRSREGAPVAAPVTWEEVKSVRAANAFTVKNMPERVRKVGDPWPGYFDVRQSITKALMKAVNVA